MDWFYNSSITKSLHDLNQLVKNVILAPDFKQEDLAGFSSTKENQVMDTYHESTSDSNDGPSPFEFDDTWIRGCVELSLPCDGVRQHSEADAPKFVVEVYHRKLIEVIKSALSEPVACKGTLLSTFLFHFHLRFTSDIRFVFRSALD